MHDKEAIIAQITSAFATLEYPGDESLTNSNHGDEPFLLEQEFKGKTDWRTLDPTFLDHAPGGFASALSFFSNEAFQFYLPAYLIADLKGQLEYTYPYYSLTLYLDPSSRFSMFNQEQAAAIVAYLTVVRDEEENELERPMIDEALIDYWYERAGLA